VKLIKRKKMSYSSIISQFAKI